MKFVKGMDLSTLLELEKCGVKYYVDGTEMDILDIMKKYDVDTIRIRLWNDPYSESGESYGAGENDLKTTLAIAKKVTDAGLGVLLNFHYSDFWADPGKQIKPKAWKDYGVEELEKAVYEFTVDTMKVFRDNGINTTMVQVGNELSNGLLWPEGKVPNYDNIAKFVNAGIRGVRAIDEDVPIMIHLDNGGNNALYREWFDEFTKRGEDFQLIGLSYYPFWHGTMDNMTAVLSEIKEKFGKDTCVLETSYPYTGEDGDASGNSVSAEDCLEDYPVSVQGQATVVRDVIAHAADAGSLGVFYWEGAWIPVGSSFSSNQELWETKGSGWASSFAGSYDPKDAGKYYGGSSWDNQAFFSFSGKKLPSLDVFKYVNYLQIIYSSIQYYFHIIFFSIP